MNNREYQFDFTKLSAGDLVFLSSIDKQSDRNPAQVARLFALLGRVTVDIDSIPAAELAPLMHAMTMALIDHVKVSAVYGSFVDTLNFDPPATTPEPETRKCARCKGRVNTDGELCHFCMAMAALRAESEALTGLNKCARCKYEYPVSTTICPACGHDHDPTAHEPYSRPHTCMICGHEWYGTQAMCPECSKRHD